MTNEQLTDEQLGALAKRIITEEGLDYLIKDLILVHSQTNPDDVEIRFKSLPGPSPLPNHMENG